jgi:hypothetical protein
MGQARAWRKWTWGIPRVDKAPAPVGREWPGGWLGVVFVVLRVQCPEVEELAILRRKPPEL